MRVSSEILIAFAVVAVLAGCGQRSGTWRTYDEVEVAAPPASAAPPGGMPAMGGAMGDMPVQKIPLKWTTPSGWTEEAGSGMRLATFNMISAGETGLCTIVTLSGPAGGLEANVMRWIGQAKLSPPDDAALAAFLDRQEKLTSEGGFPGVLIDLTQLGASPEGTPSMLAGSFTAGGSTVFVKLTGSPALLRAEREHLIQLCKSLRPGG